VEDSAALQIETESGVVGSAELSWSLPPAGDAYVTLQTSQATVVVGWQHSAIKYKGRDWETFGKPYDRAQAHRDMHHAFTRAVDHGHGLWITKEECLQAVAAVEASYRSLRSARPEPVSARPLPLMRPAYGEEATPTNQ
jgi:predicted dehydrogenase